MRAVGFVITIALCAAACTAGDGGTSSRVEGYIRGDQFSKLVIEVDSVPGMEPRAQVESDLADGLTPILDKPGGVQTVNDGTLTSKGSDHAWTFNELRMLANKSFDLPVGVDTTVMHVMFVDGHSADDTDSGKILGLAWDNTHIAMFKATIENVCAGPSVPVLIRDQVCAGTELSVWTHETGHLLGLVNNGLPMVSDHQDTTHGAHDVNDKCVMYWSYDSSAIIDTLSKQITGGGSQSLGFDQACLNDIAAVRDAP